MNTHYQPLIEQRNNIQRNDFRWRVVWFSCYVLFSCVAQVEAQIYKWVDRQGVIHFGQAPPQSAEGARTIESLQPNRKVIPSATPSQVEPEENHRLEKIPHAREERAPVVNQQVAAEMYSTSWCGYCRKAREYFRARGIPLIEYDIEVDATAAERKRRIDTRPGVPLVVINGQLIHGFVPALYEQALAGRR